MTFDPAFVTAPAEELAARRQVVQAAMRADGVDALLLVQAADVYYLSGTAQNAHLIVPAEGEPVLGVRRDLDRARAESALARVEPLSSLRALPGLLASCGVTGAYRLGLELDVLPAASYLRFRDLLGQNATLVDAMPALWAARSCKSAWELMRIAQACQQSSAAHAAAPSLLRPGRSEFEILNDLGAVMRLHGHEGAIRFRGLNQEFLWGQVLAGESATVPGPTETPLHGPGLSASQGRGASRRALAVGDAVVVDISGISEGYVSDQTRSYFIGEPDARLVSAYDACMAILRECSALLRPGVTGDEVYRRGLEVAEERGFGDGYMGAGPGRVRFVGHAIGLELNEPPYLAAGQQMPIAAGNVLALEPKVVLPGVGAVGVENSYLVGGDGPALCLTGGTEQPIVIEP